MHPALRILRPGNVLVAFVGTWVGGLAVLGRGAVPPEGSLIFLLLASVSTGLVVAGGNVLNDLGDEATDRRNHPDRPLVTGGISRAAARGLAAGLFGASVVAVLPVVPTRPLLGLLLAAALGAVFGYELWSKTRGLSGNILVAFLTGAVFLYGGAAVGNPLLLLPLALMAGAATLSREIIKDMEDAVGDVDRRTLPRTRGPLVAARAARASVVAAILLSPLPLLYLVRLPSVAAIMYLALVLATDAVFVVSVRWLPERLHFEQGMSKIAMTVALGAFLATAFR